MYWLIHKKSLKLDDNNILDPGRTWSSITHAGTINGKAYIYMNDLNSAPCYMPVAYFVLPYGMKFKPDGMKFKPGYTSVAVYRGALANSSNGYDEYHDDYGSVDTYTNTVYSDRKSGRVKLTMKEWGQDRGKNQGFFIGKTTIHMNDGEDYYPVYTYSGDGDLTVFYLKVADLDKFEPATVTYNDIGTITKNHKFKPYTKHMSD